ncbi:MAG: hypothetical protein LBQ52_04605 [Helicobacteraceae bacterium]|jgi:hypothetical protein|nr:hypothetical protein [Helicobacteraceae bacterium]
MSNIKIKRAMGGFLPAAKAHILRDIPATVIKKLSSKELGELAIGMDRHFKGGSAHAIDEINNFFGIGDFWKIIGGNFSDGLDLADIIEARWREVVAREQKPA